MSQAPLEAPEHHEHPPYLQHHFETPLQQFDAGKLGIWLFLATEILLFGGLFVAYSIYRANHPEIFVYAHQYLDKVLGGTNTVILLCSSLTMAWAVRAAQLGQRRLLILLLALTICGGFGFMGIKYVEYKAKWEHGLLPGKHFAPHEQGEAGGAHAPNLPTAPAGQGAAPSSAEAPKNNASDTAGSAVPGKAAAVAPAGQAATPNSAEVPKNNASDMAGSAATAVAAAAPPPGNTAILLPGAKGPLVMEKSRIAPSATGPGGTAHTVEAEAVAAERVHLGKRPSNVQVFFSIYFLMTGLHGIHVLVGIGLISWILFRSVRGEFGPEYFTPVDFVGLYWHLVDVIWIFLFPLLYLIGPR
jgi:cytochrome c oxidase subunit 3